MGTKIEQARLRRRFIIGFLVCFLVLFLVAVALFLRKPRAVSLSGRKVSFSVQAVTRRGPFSDERLWVHDGWDGPTGEFTHGDLYGLKIGNQLFRLDILYDPIAAIREHLPKTVAGLLNEMDSQDPLVRQCVLEALIKKAAEAKAGLPILLKRFGQADEWAECSFVELAKAVGREGVPFLIASLTKNNPKAVQKATEALGEIGAEAAIPRLTELLSDSVPATVMQSALALRKIEKQNHGEVPALIRLLAHEEAQVRMGVAYVLGEFGEDAAAAAEPLAKLLDTAPPEVAGAIVRTLGFLGPAGQVAIPRLVAMLHQDNEDNLRGVIEALGRFGEHARPAIPNLCELALQPELGGLAIRALGAIGPEAMPCLLKLYREDKRMHSSVEAAFMKLGPKAAAAVPDLIAELDSESQYRVARVAMALGCLGEAAKVSVPRLIELVHDDEPDVRVRAGEALWNLAKQTNEVLTVMTGELANWLNEPDALRSFKSDANDESRAQVITRVLSQIGPPASNAVPSLQTMLLSSFDQHRGAAADALRKISR